MMEGAYVWPFWPLVNLILLVAVVVYYGRKPFSEFLSSYETNVGESLDRAERSDKEARETLRQWRQRWREIDSEVEGLLSRSREIRERRGVEALRRAETEEQHLRNRIRDTVEQDRDRAVTEMRGEMAEALVSSVTEAMHQLVTEEDNRRLVRQFIKEIGDTS